MQSHWEALPAMKSAGALRKYTLCLVFLALAFATIVVHAQTGLATLTGIVTDQSGAVISGAIVTATHSATGQTVVSKTSAAGIYMLNALPVGGYTLTVTATGFKTESRSNIVLTSEQKAVLNIPMTVGAASATVTVSANGAVLNTESAELGQTVSSTDITQLPLNGRNPASLVTLAAGIVPGNLHSGGYAMVTGLISPNDTVVSANGGREGSVYFLLDGANNMDPSSLMASPFPNPDATEEFSVLTNNFGAQYGFAAGGVVSIVTKSGTNKWHGEAFEFVRNYDLDASDYFSHLTDTLKRNQYGVSEGGPLWRNKLFIFGNYQRTSEVTSLTGTPAYVPNTTELGGDWSQLLTGTTVNLCGSGGDPSLTFDTGQVFHPSTGTPYTCPAGTGNAGQTVYVKTPYTRNQIDPTTYDKVAMAFEENVPQTANANNLVYLPAINHPDSTNEFTIRGDYIISDKQRLQGHAFYQKYNLPTITGNGDFLAAEPSWVAPYASYTGSWIDTLSQNMVNNVTFSFEPSSSTDQPLMTDKSGNPVSLTTLGMNVPYPPGFQDSIEGFGVSGYFSAPPSGYAAIFANKAWSIGEQLSVNKGKHLIVAGVDVLHYNFNQAADWLALPLVGFTGQATGNGGVDYVLGAADSFTQGGGQYCIIANTNIAPYVQDTYHVNRSLTLTGGVRWEPFAGPNVGAGRMAAFRPGQQSTRYPNAPLGIVFPGDAGINASGGIPTNYKLISPRVGFSYNPSFLPNTTIRGAFGIFTSPYDNGYYQHSGDTAPFSPTYTLTYSQNGIIPFDDPWSVSASTNGVSPFPPFSSQTYVPPSNVSFPGPVGIETAWAKNFTLGTDQTWNLSIQQRVPFSMLLTFAYVGSETYHLPFFTDLNPGIYASLGQRTTYPAFNEIDQWDSAGTASYQGFQLTVNKRFDHGLTFTSNYTRSKAIDTQSGGIYNSNIGDPFDFRWSRGIADINHPNNWLTSFVYQTPSLSELNRPTRAVLSSWQASGIFTLQSGNPFSVTPGSTCANGGNPSYSDQGNDRADVVSGQAFGLQKGSKNQWLQQYFNPAAFTCNAVGTFGDSARNLLIGPRWNNWDTGLSKDFAVTERFKLQFRWEMFNAMNTPHFSNPASGVGNSGYTAITSLASSPRVMQFASKLSW